MSLVGIFFLNDLPLFANYNNLLYLLLIISLLLYIILMMMGGWSSFSPLQQSLILFLNNSKKVFTLQLLDFVFIVHLILRNVFHKHGFPQLYLVFLSSHSLEIISNITQGISFEDSNLLTQSLLAGTLFYRPQKNKRESRLRT